MTWRAQAEQIAVDAAEIGTDAAAIIAACWRARVDPAAAQGLAQAAIVLWATPASLLAGGYRPLPHDKEMLARTEDLEVCAGGLLHYARDLEVKISAALQSAVSVLTAAATAARASRNGREHAAAAAAAMGARRQIGDCEAALEVLADAIMRLDHAYICLGRVPDDLAATYETCYDHIHRGGKLPFSGDFLTGVPA